jgi:hypothetical protein
MAVTDPVVGCILGVTLFGERLGAVGLVPVAVTAISVVVMVGATLNLAGSPLVLGAEASDG